MDNLDLTLTGTTCDARVASFTSILQCISGVTNVDKHPFTGHLQVQLPNVAAGQHPAIEAWPLEPAASGDAAARVAQGSTALVRGSARPHCGAGQSHAELVQRTGGRCREH